MSSRGVISIVCLVTVGVGAVAGRASPDTPPPSSTVAFVYRGHVPVAHARLVVLRNGRARLTAPGVTLRFRTSPHLTSTATALARQVNGGQRNWLDAVILRSRDGRAHRFGSPSSLSVAYLSRSARQRVPLATRRDQHLVAFLKGRVHGRLRAHVVATYEERVADVTRRLTLFTTRGVVARSDQHGCRESTTRVAVRVYQRIRRRVARVVPTSRVTRRVGATSARIIDFDGGGILKVEPNRNGHAVAPRERALLRTLHRLAGKTLASETRQAECAR